MTDQEIIEFSRPISPEDLGEQGRTISIDADRSECERLAGRLSLDDLTSLSADIRLTPQDGGKVIRLEGALKAEITQTCVVTLEPIKTSIETVLDRLYDTGLESLTEDNEESIDFEAEDPPDPLSDGKIDIGEAVAEQLALEINPFPRKPGISFADYSKKPDGANTVLKRAGEVENKTVSGTGPFAGLAELKKKLKK